MPEQRIRLAGKGVCDTIDCSRGYIPQLQQPVPKPLNQYKETFGCGQGRLLQWLIIVAIIYYVWKNR